MKSSSIRWFLQFYEVNFRDFDKSQWTTLSYGELNRCGFDNKENAIKFANKINKSIDHQDRMDLYNGRRIRVRGFNINDV